MKPKAKFSTAGATQFATARDRAQITADPSELAGKECSRDRHKIH